MNPRAIACACSYAALLASAPCTASTVATGDAPLASQGKLPTSLPVRRYGGDSQGGIGWSPLVGLGVLAVGAGGWWAWARQTGRRRLRHHPGQGAAIVRLSSQGLTPHASVHAVRWNGEEYLLGCTSQGVTLLSRRAVTSTEGEAR